MKRILSLFDVTGNWPSYFGEHGWDVISVDIQNSFDILRVKNMEDALDEFENIDAIIAAPPCTDFSSSGAWTWPAKDACGTTKASMELVRQTIRLIDAFTPTDPEYDGSFFWAVENPVGRMGNLFPELGQPWYFHPYEFAGWLDITDSEKARIEELRKKPFKQLTKDDADFIQWMNLYTKKTGLWGDFIRPEKKPIEPIQAAQQGSVLQRYGGKSIATKNKRSATPHGFARAFYEANKDYEGEWKEEFEDYEEDMNGLGKVKEINKDAFRCKTYSVQTKLFPDKEPTIHYDSYDKIIVYFSGGKDSIACFLNLLDNGVDRSKIELWHHEIDGKEGSDLMDWPSTPDYCRKFAEHFGVPIYYSWREYGFEGEMLRKPGQKSHDYLFETPDGTKRVEVKPKEGIVPQGRMKFPQASADLNVRWCSAYLKIMVAESAIRNQPRLNGLRILTVSGERGEESKARANYSMLECDKTNAPHRFKRIVDRSRPIKNWLEPKVWEIIKRYHVRLHPAYYLGFGRLSCAPCVFASPSQLASLRIVNPAQFEKVASYESQFGVTIDRKLLSLHQKADKGTPYPNMKKEDIEDAMSKTFKHSIFMKDWYLPNGAYGESNGPT